MFMIDPQSKTPIFEQLKKQILEFISIGVLAPNDKLPSVRSLASTIGVNPNTVSKAYQELEQQGYLYSEKGKGCFVADNESKEMILEEKCQEFRIKVQEMKQYRIEQKRLMELIDDVYKEETMYDTNKISNEKI